MNKIKYIMFTLVTTATILSIQSCDVTNIADISLQLAINYEPEFLNRAVPDSSVEVVNLEDYPEYNDNKDKIDKAEILHFNYKIIDIKTRENLPIDSIEFDRIAFYLIPTFTSGGNRVPGQRYLLGEFNDVKVADYYKTAEHIVEVSDEVGELISEQLKETPYFIFVTEYSTMKGENRSNYFDYIDSHFDMVIRISTTE